MSRIINAYANMSNVVANARDYAVVAGMVALRLHLHLKSALGKGATSTRGLREPTFMTRCWHEVSEMRFGQLALAPITAQTSKQPRSSKRWS